MGGLVTLLGTLAPLISIFAKSQQMRALLLGESEGIDETEPDAPVEETSNNTLPTSEAEMSPRAQELMNEAKALFETELATDTPSPRAKFSRSPIF